MEKTGEQLPVFEGGCAALVLNRLMTDIFMEINFVVQVKKQALIVASFVRDHHALLDTFRQL